MHAGAHLAVHALPHLAMHALTHLTMHALHSARALTGCLRQSPSAGEQSGGCDAANNQSFRFHVCLQSLATEKSVACIDNRKRAPRKFFRTVELCDKVCREP